MYFNTTAAAAAQPLCIAVFIFPFPPLFSLLPSYCFSSVFPRKFYNVNYSCLWECLIRTRCFPRHFVIPGTEKQNGNKINRPSLVSNRPHNNYTVPHPPTHTHTQTHTFTATCSLQRQATAAAIVQPTP